MDLWTSPTDRREPCGPCGQPVDNADALPTACPHSRASRPQAPQDQPPVILRGQHRTTLRRGCLHRPFKTTSASHSNRSQHRPRPGSPPIPSGSFPYGIRLQAFVGAHSRQSPLPRLCEHAAPLQDLFRRGAPAALDRSAGLGGSGAGRAGGTGSTRRRRPGPCPEWAGASAVGGRHHQTAALSGRRDAVSRCALAPARSTTSRSTWPAPTSKTCRPASISSSRRIPRCARCGRAIAGRSSSTRAGRTPPWPKRRWCWS